ncbi:hypothetical protein I2I05_11070 [Hymenobacter sp. BT683]|uniref:Uncharacterized protein n=1 Tax=Hymenobacter jeongseonensis TaxID=2791027 RepID=A0ABS0IJH0_9BACT|nr:hypothetical protein [Hymenobacter jeongseonensis]MBF9237935.1 hypothetical protein [Hymenobacter jeongseonensis]
MKSKTSRIEFKTVQAYYCGTVEAADWLPGWSYDLEICEHTGQVTYRQPGTNHTEQTLPVEAFQQVWQLRPAPATGTGGGIFARLMGVLNKGI